jgi:hypothetical protein
LPVAFTLTVVVVLPQLEADGPYPAGGSIVSVYVAFGNVSGAPVGPVLHVTPSPEQA